MSGSRWLAVLTLTVVIALGASRADAQVFKPRTGKAAIVASKTAIAAAAPSSTTVAKKTGAVAATPAATAKKPARATPHRTARKRGKARGDSEDVVIDDDDEDVKITDD